MVNCERAKLMSCALAAKDTTLNSLMLGAIYRLQLATGTEENITETLRPIVNKDRGINKEWAFQLYTWMRTQEITITMPPATHQPYRENDKYLIDLAHGENTAILARYTEHANKLSHITEQNGTTLNPGSPMRDDKEWMNAMQTATGTTTRKNNLKKEHELGEWRTHTTETLAQNEDIKWDWAMDINNALWHKQDNGHWTEYINTGSNKWTPKEGHNTPAPQNMRRCIVAKIHPRAIPKNAGQPYNGNIPHTCTMDSCLDKYCKMTPTSEKDSDTAEIIKWDRGGPRIISFHLKWGKPDEEGNEVNTVIGKTELDRMTNDSHATRTNLTKCNSCFEAFCHEHTATEAKETGWKQADASNRFCQYGRWLCPKCNKTNNERALKETMVKILHTSELVTTTSPITPDTEPQPHTWIEEHRDQSKWLRHALNSDEPMCRIYSDGSAKHTQGSYGWIAGVEIGSTKTWKEIARGGGVEKVSDNPARKITSARTEALGVLRAKQYMEKKWPGKIEIRLDNTTVVKRHNELGDNKRKRWNKVDNDIWDQMTRTRQRNCTTIYVKGHADDKKKKKDITEHEHLNIVTDNIAEQMYHRAKTLEHKHGAGQYYERTDATSTTINAGDCYIRGHRIVGDNTKSIMTYIGTEIALEYWTKDWKKYSAAHSTDTDVIQIDELLMRSIQKGEMHMPAIGTYTKILHGILATNHILTQRKDPKTKTNKCECCTADEIETNNHMLGKCTHDSIAAARKKMITKLHKTIDKTLRHGKEKMQINPTVTTALCHMWSSKTMEHISAHPTMENAKSNMEHVWDWVSDYGTKECLKDITKPGARLMWTGTFTKNWTTNLTKMGINEATALKLARKIRKQIMYNTTAIWHTRCNITHDNKERDEIITKMREVANDAKKLGVFEDANKSVQRACEINKKLADKKKWIIATEKRIKNARRDKTNQQKRNFMQHFAKRDENRNIDTEDRHTTGGKITTEPDDDEEEEADVVHAPRHTRQTKTAKIAKQLDSSDSEEESIPENKHTTKAPQTPTETTTKQTEPESDKEEPNHEQESQLRKRPKLNKTGSKKPMPPQLRNAQLTQPPTGGAAARGGGGARAKNSMSKRKREPDTTRNGRDRKRAQPIQPPSGGAAAAAAEGGGASAKTSRRKRKRTKDATSLGTNQKRKNDKKSNSNNKRERNQRSMHEYTRQPATCAQTTERQSQNHTTRVQEDTPGQQNRSQSSYDTG